MPVETVPTPSAPRTGGPYSPVVRAGDWLVLAGQVGFDPATGALAEGVAAQTRQALGNVAALLADCGATLSDVAKTTVFLADMDDYQAMNDVYAGVFAGHLPARSTIGVAALPFGARVEIEAWVYHPGG